MAEAPNKIDFSAAAGSGPAVPAEVDPDVAALVEKMRLSAQGAAVPGPTKSERLRMISRWKTRADGR